MEIPEMKYIGIIQGPPSKPKEFVVHFWNGTDWLDF